MPPAGEAPAPFWTGTWYSCPVLIKFASCSLTGSGVDSWEGIGLMYRMCSAVLPSMVGMGEDSSRSLWYA